jgi:hypothetical protein
MQAPRTEDIARLLRWRPTRGVVSVYLDIDPGDRGGSWFVELRNGISAALEEVRASEERETYRELEPTAARIVERFAEGGPHEGRSRIGFVEVAAKSGRERWYAAQVPAGETRVIFNRRPFVHPLIAMLDRGASRGVAALSAERVRLLRWSMGRIEDLGEWDLELFSLDWRERKAQRPGDPARTHGVSAAGRDQFGQRLEANRERFLREAGKRAASEMRERGWREVLAFGPEDDFRAFAEGFGPGSPLRHAESHNLISVETHEIETRLEALLDELSRAREMELIERAKDGAYAGGRATLGVRDTLQALVARRVEQLL